MGLRRKHNETATQKNLVTQEIPAYSPYKGRQDDHIELDAIERLKSNIAMLDDLQKRLAFMNQEIEGVIGSRKKS